MSFPSTTPKVIVAGPFGNADPTADKEYTIFYTEYCPIEITKVYVTNDVQIPAHSANYLSISLESGTTNTGGTELFEADTRSNHESVIEAGTLYPLNETEGTVAISQYITFAVAENSGTTNMTDMMVIIYYVEGSPASE